MNFTLEIYINTGQRGTYSLYSQGICELTYSGFTIRKNDEEESDTYKFPVWGTIQVEIRNEVKINDDEFYEVGITSKFWNHFCILKSDIEKLKVFCDKRNQQMLLNKESICSYIDKDILNIAENLLNIIEEDIMLNYRAVAYFHINYSHIESKIFNRNYSTKGEYRYHYRLFKDTYGVKGKEKKDAEQFNNELRQKINETSKIIDNFIEIIVEEKNVRKHIAKAIAWEAVQRKALEYYSQKWIEEYENNLEKTFDELYIDLDVRNIEEIKYDYTKKILLNEKIDIEHSQDILMYFLLSKYVTKDLILCDSFIEYYEILRKLKQDLDSSDIKQKLKTKQKRKIIKYSIDDIDLMNGIEFEEFIALLFKKMGYSSQTTKQSGDQGIDVIAVKNGVRIGIQAKCYSNTVGNTAIQEAVAGKSFYNCDKAVVITNSYFSTAAIELTHANNVILWNRDLLKEKLKELM